MLQFFSNNARWLSAGVLLSLISSFGQTFFISVFAGEIRSEFNLSHGAWGGYYSIGTTVSAIVMVWAGVLTDVMRVRTLGALTMVCLAVACVMMATVTSAWMLPFVIFALRFTGQGMTSHIAAVAMARWFVAARGRALAISGLGFAFGEALLPLTFVTLMVFFDWRMLWLLCAVVIVAFIPVLLTLLKEERSPKSSATAEVSTGMNAQQWTRKQALSHWLFWAILPALIAPSTFITALFFHQVHLAGIKGWGHALFVSFFPLYTAVGVISALLSGAMIDRVGTARLMPFYQIPLALGFLVLWYAQSPVSAGLALAILGVTAGTNSTLTSAFWAEFYGTRHLGAIKAAVAGALVFGSAIGPAITGVLIDYGYSFPQQMIGISVYILLVSSIVAIAMHKAKRLLPVAP
ncbi:MFS transporter [Cochlodiniinecator piscidefendens]|uniref:MFS transporter n=1 Tax=Cochlodiniinecator piscidefendens TaxID=2715756 RepID=UPI0014091297|nr:MFS transporter [Cochlodiniinecator piscidefendens]